MSHTAKDIHRYAPAGMCIYCRSLTYTPEGGKLHEEHTVPYSLEGRFVIPEASCKACEDITKKFEGTVARKSLIGFRTKENVQTRHPKERPKVLPMTKVSGEVISVPVEDHPGDFPVFVFPEPTIINGDHIHPRGIRYGVIPHAALNADKAKEELGWDGVVRHDKNEVYDFCRMLAKVGHAQACGELGIDGFVPLLLDIIRGENLVRDIPRLIGSNRNALEPTDQHFDVRMAYRMEPRPPLVMVKIRLFPFIGMPQYLVVVGRADTEEQISLFREKREDKSVISVTRNPLRK